MNVRLRRFQLRAQIAAHRSTSTLLLHFPAADKHRNAPVDRATDLLVDGFQSSGNDFVTRTIKAANPGLIIRGHFHSSGQVKKAASLNIPTILLFRDPIEVAISGSIRWPWLTPETILRGWSQYYSAVIEHLDSPASRIYLASFSTITTSLEETIHEIDRQLDIRLGPLTVPPGSSTEDLIEEGHRDMRAQQKESFRSNISEWDGQLVKTCTALFSGLTESLRTTNVAP
jgi:hypothetical protein